MRITKKSVAALGVAGAIAFAAVPAVAQEATQTPTEESATQESATDQATARDERMAEHQAAFAEALAAELNLPVDQVTEAVANVGEQLRAEHDAQRQAALQERLDEAVASGDLTQEQADAMAAAAEAGVLGGRGGHRGMGGFGPPTAGGDEASPNSGA